MSRWKVLAATPFVLIPLAFASVSVGDGIEHHESRPTVVLPSLVEGPQVTMRPTAPDRADPGNEGPRTGPGKQSPGRQDPSREGELTCTQDDDDDDDRDDDEVEVEVVQPCPDAVGDDDDDDGDDDGDDADGDD